MPGLRRVGYGAGARGDTVKCGGGRRRLAVKLGVVANITVFSGSPTEARAEGEGITCVSKLESIPLQFDYKKAHRREQKSDNNMLGAKLCLRESTFRSEVSSPMPTLWIFTKPDDFSMAPLD
jgi:hypothetical protein